MLHRTSTINRSLLKSVIVAVGITILSSCSDPQTPSDNEQITEIELLNNRIINTASAYIPAQCYTKTKSELGKVHNPCFSCHTTPQKPNFINDVDLQLEYSFRETTRKNPWQNIFKDRSQQVSQISNQSILKYVRESNYFNDSNQVILAKKMAKVPKIWDVNGDNKWNGYTPDCYYNFDNQGFDRKPNGELTGWRAFIYTPFYGTFWPTNGSTNDVLIRLSAPFRQDENGHFNLEVYKINLAILESIIQRKDVAIPPTDESQYNVDLNRNGIIDISNQIVYRWAPKEGKFMSYVGQAKTHQEQQKIHLAAGLYPVGTEFLHSVRYIDIDQQGNPKIANRFKELRYGIKTNWNTYSQLNNAAVSEVKELRDFPERLRRIQGNPEAGMLNGLGWAYQGFIEDKKGELRPQSYEETLYCIGCHSGIGATTDSSFSFARKISGTDNSFGWNHWTQKSLHGIPEPQYKNGTWQYTEYLLQNHSANEFRNNEEVIVKFFDEHGKLKQSQIEILHKDISHLLLPSAKRALELNKAYKVIVDEQSYVYGRDPHIKPITSSWDIVPINEKTGIESPITHNE
ncbi:hypothetical protein THMIRHAM_19810 [Thiomicrorhabdus immobilis]|uniref:Lipoprotein n=1 Tax=Thiomicrorhabdus immobilis TaxID=2791037 RepID=A0ABN6CYM3_9GAMM|nr:hypothetical protein [Thiomicrorhabdus immobilis]BCN94196.1 hypothetical protein THMIRHAM_19810 [Thiomicrorhabdus immobilis]